MAEKVDDITNRLIAIERDVAKYREDMTELRSLIEAHVAKTQSTFESLQLAVQIMRAVSVSVPLLVGLLVLSLSGAI